MISGVGFSNPKCSNMNRFTSFSSRWLFLGGRRAPPPEGYHGSIGAKLLRVS
jgi:hypothetical protein